jgi:DNA-binding CsgD family transcriptional regulator
MSRQGSAAEIFANQRKVSGAIARSDVPLSLSSSLRCAAQQPEAGEAGRDHTLTAVLERIDCAYLVVDRYQRIIDANAAAQRMLDQAVGPAEDASRRYQFVRETINRCGVGLKFGSLIWITTSRNRGITTSLVQIDEFTSDLIATILLVDLDAFPAPNPTTLRRLFGLTFAECRLAFHLAQGKTPKEVATLLGVSRATVGSQLGALFSKTNTKRQAELVALLGRIAVLP